LSVFFYYIWRVPKRATSRKELMTQKIEPKVEAPVEPEVIKIGEQEYKPEELQEMVGFAGKVRDFEKKSGTDFDGLTSSWGKRGEEIGKLKAELEEAKKPKSEIKPEEGELSLDQVQDQARKLGIVTQADLDKYLEDKLSLREQGRDLLKSCDKLERKIDGKDGRPAFKTEEMLKYMKENGVKNSESAYKLKFEKELDAWKEAELAKKKPSGLMTENRVGGQKQPSEVRITADNLDKMVNESLNQGQV